MSKHLISDDWIANALQKAKMCEHFPGLIATKPAFNPCVKVFGAGPDATFCKTCSHLKRYRRSNTYIKCDLRPHTNGPGTDHRVGWPACSKYSEEPKQ